MRAPGFWSDPTAILPRVLAPLGMIYGAATRARLYRAPRYHAPIPVICVGNIAAGGSGKTPVVQALARAAVARGVAVHCLTRGYGGRLKGPLRVEAHHSAADVGDEPLLLASIAPTWVARDRAAGARAAVAAGAQLLILDDGLQNPALAHDLSLLVIDGGFGFGNGRMIPAGPLRETIADVGQRIAAAIIIGGDKTQVRAKLPRSLSIIAAQIRPQSEDMRDRRVIAFAGLGRPEKFRETLSDLGAEIMGWFPFPDHHPFSAADLRRLAEAATAADATLVTTEKDFVRLPPEFQAQVTALAIVLTPEDTHAWDSILDRVLP